MYGPKPGRQVISLADARSSRASGGWGDVRGDFDVVAENSADGVKKKIEKETRISRPRRGGNVRPVMR